MPKVSDEYRAAKRDEIAQAALRCFARTGFQATSMADIITESGLSAGAIYGHYKSKTDLIQYAIGGLLDTRFTDLEEALASETLAHPVELVIRFLDGVDEFIGNIGLLLQIWAEAAVEPDLRAVASRVTREIGTMYGSYLAAWYEREEHLSTADAAARGAAEAPVYLAFCQGYVVQASLFADFDRAAYLDGVRSALKAPQLSGATAAAATTR